MTSSRRSSRHLAIALAAGLALVTAACSSAASPTPTPVQTAAPTTAPTASPTPSPKPDAIRVQMAFTLALSPQYSTYFVGAKAGIYAKWGLDPTFVEGTGSAASAQLIATNGADFGAAVDAGSAMRAVSKGASIWIIGETLPSVTMAVISKGSNCLKTPQDIVGKKIAVPPGSSQSQMTPAFLKINKIDPASFEQENVAASALVAGLLAGTFDGYVSYTVGNIPILTAQGANPCAILFSDYGVNLSPGETIIVNSSLIQQKPDLVKRFVQAVAESQDYAVAHPDEACAAGVAMFPDQIKPDICKPAVQVVVDQIKAAEAKDPKPLSCINDAQVNTLLDLLVNYAAFTNRLDPSKYYTNQFMPGC